MIDHLDKLKSMDNRALIYWKQNRLAEADNVAEQVMEILKIKFGANHPDTLTSMACLALMYMKQVGGSRPRSRRCR